MAKPYDSGSSSEGTPSNGSIASEKEEEEEVRNGAEANIEEEIDEEDLEAVARTAGPDDDEAKGDSGQEDAREDEDDGDEYGEEEHSEIGKREKAGLREMHPKKKQKIQEMLDTQNASIDADMEKYDELELAQRCSTASDQPEGSEPSVGNDLSIWLKASGGSKGGKDTRNEFSPQNSSSSYRAQIDSLAEEIAHLKEIILQRDDKIREMHRQQDDKIREMRRQQDDKIREMRRQQDDKIREMRRQQDWIMRQLQLGFLRQLPPPGTGDDGGDDGLMKSRMTERKRKNISDEKESDTESII